MTTPSPQPNRKLRVLILEDSPTDAELLVRELRQAGFDPDFTRVETEAAFLAALEPPPELILSDYSLPQFDGLRAAERLRERSLDIPFILVSDTLGEEAAVAAFKHGVADYLLKDRLRRLGPAVAQALESKRLRDEGKCSEEQLRLQAAALAAAANAIVITDREGTIQWVNPAWTTLTGYTPEETRGQNPRLLKSGRHDEAFYRGLWATVRAGKVWRAELINRRKDGQLYLEDQIIAPVTDAAGRITHFVGIKQDITARKQAEASRRESEERFRSLYEHSPVGLYRTTPDGRILLANPALVRMLGYASFAELAAQNLEDKARFHPRFPRQDFARSLASEGAVHGSESAWIRADGTPVYVRESALAVRDREGRVLYYDGVVEDVTAHRQAQEQLRAQARLLNLAQDAIVVRDLEGRVRFWNQGAERISGWTAAEAMGQSSDDLLQLDPAAVVPAWQALQESGGWSGEINFTARNGRKVTVMCRATLVRGADGQPESALVIATDITEKKQLEASFLRAQRLEGVGALASGVAHDLNNLLAPVMMIAPLLRDVVPDDESRAMLNTIESCAQRGAEIIRQLLTFARGAPGTRVHLPLRHLVHEVEKIIRETFPREITPRVTLAPNLWPVLGDATQIQQAMLNLCLNARDAMPEGGSLTLTARNVTVDAAFAAMVPDAQPGLYVCVEVADTGTGIAPENMDRIFDPFFTTKEIGKGTGLGLATVLGIVKGHEGFVRVESQLGEGATFELYFPAACQPPAPPAPAMPGPPRRGRRELILVVDDEAAVRDSLRQTLETHGYRVVTAAEGVEGLAAFAKHQAEVRVVLTDMMMPAMNGAALITALRILDGRVPVLGMSGLAERREVKGLDQLALAGFLVKPFPGGELLRLVADALAKTDAAPEPGRAA